MSEQWTGEKNTRRCNLIDSEIAGCISPTEFVELQVLQREMLEHRRAMHPLPIKEARQMLESLWRRSNQRRLAEDSNAENY